MIAMTLVLTPPARRIQRGAAPAAHSQDLGGDRPEDPQPPTPSEPALETPAARGSPTVSCEPLQPEPAGMERGLPMPHCRPFGAATCDSQALPLALNPMTTPRQVIYADDRSWATRTARLAYTVYQQWCHYVRMLGLQDNQDKLQLWARRPQQRLELQALFGKETKDHIMILGSDIHYDEHHHDVTTYDQDDHEHLMKMVMAERQRKRRPNRPPCSDSDTDNDDDNFTVEQLAWRQRVQHHLQSAASDDDEDDTAIADLARPRKRRRVQQRRPTAPSPLTEHEKARLARAERPLHKLRSLKLPWARTARLAAAVSTSIASYGWLARLIPHAAVRKYQRAVHTTLRLSATVETHLAAILVGHGTSLDFKQGAAVLTQLVQKMRSTTSLRPTAGWLYTTVARWLHYQGWQPRAADQPHVWTHGRTKFTMDWLDDDLNISKLRHELREGWRAHHYYRYVNSGRLELRSTKAPPYDTKRCAATRQAVQGSRAHLTAATAGIISDARFATMTENFKDPPPEDYRITQRRCNFCHARTGTLRHQLWRCPCNPCGSTPSYPTIADMDPLLSRLAWPTSGTHQQRRADDTTVIQHITSTHRRLAGARHAH